MPASLSDPSDYYFAVTPSNTANAPRAFRSLRIGAAGDVVVVRKDGAAVTFKNCQGGECLPVEGVRVNATGTTAADIVAYA
ncbi:hypothetical protein GobsT_12350 [Gemmata obscuriglobus]|uniref:Uncharacterized protein n=1 Tax=Gemmata obscuriglobus TaxID=114 RepID=A0A2Z3HBR1_9BACT|nr:hypothetical protein [Gemmata obscuriglobus]AWM42401.1 hypothetical protein C1280_27020 [Gemmata obscuriglobus]QEG26495.1 hypothetical protein GobsT_12350 [Gemmata obscuriglobus]VTS01773.1 Uncharacterized protein OS=Burkholderia sacchari GN=NH14_31290 PE=4 SV=1 [Gemmata obscuriglobus UQM 2246]